MKDMKGGEPSDEPHTWLRGTLDVKRKKKRKEYGYGS
jgi:hypothetical protein